MAKGKTTESKIKYVVTAQDDKALASFKQQEAAQKKVEAQFKKTSKASEKQDMSIKSLAAGYVSLAAGMALVNKAVEFARTLEEGSKAGAERAGAVGRGMIPLQQVLPPGAGEAESRMAAMHGARFGISPSESLATYAQMQSITGDLSETAALSQQVFMLQQLGVDPEQAMRIPALMRAMGRDPATGTSIAVLAAERSPLNIGQFSQGAAAMTSFTSPEAGAAALAAMAQTQRFQGRRLETFTRAAGQALTTPSAFTKGMASIAQQQGQNFETMSEVDKLAFIQANVQGTGEGGAITEADLIRAGLAGEEKARGLGGLLSQREFFGEIFREAQDVPREFTQRLIEREREENPQIRRTFEAERARAQHEAALSIGPTADVAQREEERRLELGRRLRKGGAGFLVEDTGEPGFFTNEAFLIQEEPVGFALGPLPGFGASLGRRMKERGKAGVEQERGQAKINDQLDALLDETRHQTNTIEANQGSSRQGGNE